MVKGHLASLINMGTVVSVYYSLVMEDYAEFYLESIHCCYCALRILVHAMFVAIGDCAHVGSATASLRNLVTVAQENYSNQATDDLEENLQVSQE